MINKYNYDQKVLMGRLKIISYFRSFRLAIPTRNVHWGVQWGVIEDSMLLLGMLIYGVGNWDAIKNDPKLELSSKVGVIESFAFYFYFIPFSLGTLK